MGPELITLLAQIPIVGAVFWFVLEIEKRSGESLKERDLLWMEFLKTQGAAHNKELEKIALELGGHSFKLAEISNFLGKQTSKLEDINKKFSQQGKSCKFAESELRDTLLVMEEKLKSGD